MKFKQNSLLKIQLTSAKNLVLLGIFIIATITADAKNYYFSSSTGSDSYSSTQAQSEATPWRSIAKLNSFFASILPGDNIYFKRGDTFYGTIVISKSGTSTALITLGAYGTGAKPVITGLTTLSSWTSVGNGVYESYAPLVKNSVNLVMLNDVPQAVGRYPNADAANGGFLSYDSYSGTTSITDNQLTSATNWTGAEVVIRKQNYSLERCKITNHSSSVINYASLPSINPANNPNPTPIGGTNGWGYFIQRDARTLDKLGEWFFNTSTKNLQMHFGTGSPASYKVEVSTLDTLVRLSNKTFITIENLAFEGANAFSIHGKDGDNITITSCDIAASGGKGLFLWNSGNVDVDGVTFTNNLSNAVDITSRYKQNITVSNCNISNTGMLAGMGSFWDDNDYKALGISVSSGALVEYNNIQNTGYVGIQFQGNNVMIRNNFINYYDIVKDDGGGIYSYQTVSGPTYSGRVVKSNIIMNGVGAKAGTTGTIDVDGIFLDGATMKVDVLDNTMANIGVNGIYCNNPNTISIRGNTCFNNGSGIGITRYTYGTIQNLSIKNNIFYAKDATQSSFEYVNTGLNLPSTLTIQQAMQQVGDIDSNYYSLTNATGFPYRYVSVSGGAWTFPKPMSFAKWRSFTGHENAAATAPEIASYKLNSLIGSNLVSNSQLTSTLSGVSVWSPNSNITYGWDNTGKISGGSIKISPATSSTDFTLLYGNIGAVSSSKKYILRFTTVGSSEGGVLRAYIRKAAAPQNTLATAQAENFGTSKTVHEFLIDAPTSDAAASFAIEIQQSSGVTYVDDIQFYEADASLLDLNSQLRFEYNATKNPKTITLDAQYIGTDKTVYNGSITLQPYTSKILFRNGAVVVTTPPPPATTPSTTLGATATAAAVNCFGTNTSAVVSATGGTAPYKGTGTFSVNAGNGALKISVANPTKYGTLIYYTIGAVSSDKIYVLRFSSLSGVTDSVSAYLRQTASPYGTISNVSTQKFGTSRTDHEFYFKPTVSSSAASFVIELPQYTAATYIDNVAFFESAATGALISDNKFAGGNFESGIAGIYLWSFGNIHTAEWDVTSKISNTYYYPVADATGAISSAVAKISQPAATLTARATASSIIGGVATVTISATGGTAPYTGTGTVLNVLPGTYNYWVTDAKGCRSMTSVTITLLGARGATTSTSQTAARTAGAAAVTETSKVLTANAYPNPTSTNFNLNVSGGSTDLVSIIVSGVDGRAVHQTQGATNRNYSFGNNLMAGVYFVKVIQGTTIQTIKVIKTN